MKNSAKNSQFSDACADYIYEGFVDFDDLSTSDINRLTEYYIIEKIPADECIELLTSAFTQSDNPELIDIEAMQMVSKILAGTLSADQVRNTIVDNITHYVEPQVRAEFEYEVSNCDIDQYRYEQHIDREIDRVRAA
jgi:uncharacterized membrane-anchored protein YjiN (DUF445 family)